MPRAGMKDLRGCPWTTRNREFSKTGKIVGKRDVNRCRCFLTHLGARWGKVFPPMEAHECRNWPEWFRVPPTWCQIHRAIGSYSRRAPVALKEGRHLIVSFGLPPSGDKCVEKWVPIPDVYSVVSEKGQITNCTLRLPPMWCQQRRE